MVVAVVLGVLMVALDAGPVAGLGVLLLFCASRMQP